MKPALRCAVVGDPIAHSLSPVMHRAAYRQLGVEGRYDALRVPAGALAEALAPGGPGAELTGVSVTMPLKAEALALAAEADELSRRLGVANTLLRPAPGEPWRAENHDVAGIVTALTEGGVTTPRSALLWGSGATAHSAVAALLELGVTQLWVGARSPERAAEVIAGAQRDGVDARGVPWSAPLPPGEVDVVVSALAAPGAQALLGILDGVPGGWLLPAPVLFDVLYHPWPTPLAAHAAHQGVQVISGLEMLLHQAGRQVERMTGHGPAPLTAMRAAALAELQARAGHAAGTT
ncbi:shikimate dehydrogenase [Brachybacterium sp. EF45031]|uniref:shikimate dehydrogenase n=1 Tax=Brachybacterium sillae TaxID=2810536 RepID=UPI00217D2E80|nr:shikimate dehydrogenase [Brachybacterium sillae]MCS6710702.1 shikimate dehydrogenase [Brachybacterium sillae]